MIGDRIELPSARGDQTIGTVRFVSHGSTLASGGEIMQHGLAFMEGRRLVTTDLLQAQHDAAEAGDGGVITILAIPSDFHLGYAAFTTAYIDRATKLVLGAPQRYAQARNQLALYMDADPEGFRRRMEMEAATGAPVNRPSFVVDSQHVIGRFVLTEALQRVLSWLEVSAKTLEQVDFPRVESSLGQLFECREPAQEVLVPSMVRSLVVGTVEAIVISRIREMRWQGLALLGYRFTEDHREVSIEPASSEDEQRRRIDEYGRLLASSSLFTGELAWLKTYTAHQLDLMRVELDGAELEAA